MSTNAADPWSEFAPADPTGPDMARSGAQAGPIPVAAAATSVPAPTPGSDPWSEFKPAPDSPAPITDSGTTMGFADQAPTEAGKQLSPEDTATFYKMFRGDGAPKATADELRAFVGSKGLTLQDADEIVQDRDAGKGVVGQISYPLPKVDSGDGAAGAATRGLANGLTLGLAPRLFAVGDSVNDLAAGKGWDYTGNLDEERGRAATDEEAHPVAHIAGELLGGIVLPVGLEKAGLTATVESVGLAAGRDALREGLSMPEARAIAARAITKRLAAEGAAYGGAYGADGSYGSPGERLLSAGTGAVEGAVGGAALGGIGEMLAPGIAARAADARALPTPDAALVGQAADRQGISILPQDVGGPGVGRATQGAAQTTFGTATVRNAANKLYNSFRNRVGQIADGADAPVDVGNMVATRAQQVADRGVAAADRTSGAVQDAVGTPVDTTAAGQAAQRGVSRFMEDTKQKASDLYNAVPIDADKTAQLGNTRQTLANLTAQWASNPKLGAMFRNSRLGGYLDALTPKVRTEPDPVFAGVGGGVPKTVSTGGNLSWQDLSEFRTRVGDMLDDPKLSEDIATRQLKALYGSLSSDMEATAQDAGPDALKSWKRANNYYDGRMKRINDTLSMVVGDRQDRTPNEAIGALQATLRDGTSGNAAAFQRVMRSIPAEDAQTVRATLVNQARGGAAFDPATLAKTWGGLSERGKSALLPQPGMRSLMDDAANRAAGDASNPFAGKSGEAVMNALETMGQNRGDSVRFNQTLLSMSPEEANTVRATLINRLGTATPGAQNADGTAFSIGGFLTRWNKMTPEAKRTLFGSGEMRSNMDDLAMLADRVKNSEKLAGHSNTGAVNNFNATTGGLAGALGALFTGHPIVAAGLAAPAAYQRLSAEVLTSPRLVRWFTKLPTKPNSNAVSSYISGLSNIARTEPSIANDVLNLQGYLTQALAVSPGRAAAADDVGNRRQKPPNQQGQSNTAR